MNKLLNDKFNLEERTLKFSQSLIVFLKTIKVNIFNENIIRQLLKSGTSVGANYREANGAESKKDFCHKIGICKKESKESQYWLDLLLSEYQNINDVSKYLKQEVHEYVLMFSKIFKSSKSKK